MVKAIRDIVKWVWKRIASVDSEEVFLDYTEARRSISVER